MERVEELVPGPPPRSLFGANGELLPSDEVVAGLALPRGIEDLRHDGRQHVFYMGVAVARVQGYFGPRLVTGEVERVGDGAVFRRAVPRDARGGVVRMDVSITPVSRQRTRVEIREIPPAPHAFDEDATRRQLERDMRRWD